MSASERFLKQISQGLSAYYRDSLSENIRGGMKQAKERRKLSTRHVKKSKV